MSDWLNSAVSRPTREFYRSARNGLLFGLIGGSICLFICSLGIILFVILLYSLFGLIIVLQVAPSGLNSTSASSSGGTDLQPLLSTGLIFGFASCFVIGLLTGWRACIRHYILRWLLWRNDSIPWNYARFLDYAAERILLRKVGGGYIFVHRLLLDYFASIETPSLKKHP